MASGDHIFERLSSPIFEAPPVVETALGVRFAPVEGFTPLHLGQIIPVLQEKGYSRYELKPPAVPNASNHVLTVETDPAKMPVRCWYVSDDDSQLLQVQRDLFIRNWRATDSNSKYQHYQTIRPLFERDWQIFRHFLEQQKLKAPEVLHCEVTYVNHLLRGREWKSYEDLSALFPVWRGVKLENLFTAIEVSNFAVVLRLPEDAGRIQFELLPGVRADGAELFQLTVTASGKPATSSDADVLKWLDVGHLAVVNGFVQFTSPDAHKLWRKK